ncbi:MAG: amylo-alpha-1,6-glucosidase [Caldimicrobium sp.]
MSHLYTSFTPYEWILTNKKGGYALGTAFLANVRKYHGLLIAGTSSSKRYHLLSCIEEKITFPSGLYYFLDTNFYPDALYPEGYKLIKEFYLRPFPSYYYFCPKSRELFLRKSMQMSGEENAILITYENISSYPYKLNLRPKVTFRDHHTLSYANDWREFNLEINEKEAFLVKGDLALFLYLNNGIIKEEPIFYYQAYYPLEEIRGYPAKEDLFSPYLIEVELKPGDTLYLLFSDKVLLDPIKEIELIQDRYAKFSKFFSVNQPFKEEALSTILELILRDFIIKGDIIAGYPWFYCWGRDTFIGLPALFYLKEGKELSLEIFNTYIKRQKNGLIPNVVGTEEETNYNSVDSTLWFLLRIFEYLQFYKGKISKEVKKKLLSPFEEFCYALIFNTNLPFYLDTEDGLIEIPDTTNKALTWMDVVINGKPLTPRYGKPIEISFLWHNVLKFSLNYFSKSFFKKYKIEEYLAKQEVSLKKYFGENLIADRIYRGEPIYEIRPNFVIALSLPYTPVSHEEIKKAIKLAQEELLTPYGLRSLSPRHPEFKRKYFGNQYQRDLAYHNGSVWVWLLYPYGRLLKKVLSEEEYLNVLKKILYPFKELILSRKIGSIPELYDGENPYFPKGAPAQFWSVSALYLLEKEREILSKGGK